MDYFKLENASAEEIVTSGAQDVPGKNGKTFKRIYYNWRKGTKTGQVLAMMLGIKGTIKLEEDKEGQDNKGPKKEEDKVVKLIIKLDREDYYNGLMQLEWGRRHCIAANKGAIGKNSFTPENPGDNHRSIVFESCDKEGKPTGDRYLTLKFRFDSRVLIMGMDETTKTMTETEVSARSLVGHSVEGILTFYFPCDTLVNNNLYPQIYVRKLNIVKAMPKADVDYRGDDDVQGYLSAAQADVDSMKTLSDIVSRIKMGETAKTPETQVNLNNPQISGAPLNLPQGMSMPAGLSAMAYQGGNQPQMPQGMPQMPQGMSQMSQGMSQMTQGMSQGIPQSIPQGMMGMISNANPMQPNTGNGPTYGMAGHPPPTGADMNQYLAGMYNPNFTGRPM